MDVFRPPFAGYRFSSQGKTHLGNQFYKRACRCEQYGVLGATVVMILEPVGLSHQSMNLAMSVVQIIDNVESGTRIHD